MCLWATETTIVIPSWPSMNFPQEILDVRSERNITVFSRWGCSAQLCAFALQTGCEICLCNLPNRITAYKAYRNRVAATSELSCMILKCICSLSHAKKCCVLQSCQFLISANSRVKIHRKFQMDSLYKINDIFFKPINPKDFSFWAPVGTNQMMGWTDFTLPVSDCSFHSG